MYGSIGPHASEAMSKYPKIFEIHIQKTTSTIKWLQKNLSHGFHKRPNDFADRYCAH